jgi:hypothetical protein
MSRTIIPLTLAASLAFGGAALAQSSGGGSGGAAGGGSGGGAGTAGGSAATGAASPGAGPAPNSTAAPSGSISPSTADVGGGSTIPRARTRSDFGLPQPGEGTVRTTGSIGPSSSAVSPSTTRQLNERDRALDRGLLGGSGICQGC